MENECYYYEKLKYNNNILFENTVDATYIITLINNGRLNDVKNRLMKIHPTKIVYIVHNKGFKKCKKAEFITKPPLDLVDANLDIFKHAKQNNYNNILILEDDYFFSEDIKDHIKNVNEFLIKHQGIEFQYYLGCVPNIMLPYDKYHYQQSSIGTHAVIFSKEMREKMMKTKQENISDWDYFCNLDFFTRITYYKPLSYQLFPETENSLYWGSNIKYMPQMLVNFQKNILKFLNLDNKPEPGYTIFYYLGKILFYVYLIIIIYLLLKFLR
jgi:hypothetical protein